MDAIDAVEDGRDVFATTPQTPAPLIAGGHVPGGNDVHRGHAHGGHAHGAHEYINLTVIAPIIQTVGKLQKQAYTVGLPA